MQSFTDNAGRVWCITVNVGAIKRVRALCDGLNLLDLITTDSNGNPNASVLEKLSTDPVLLVDVLYSVCKPEADAKGITDEEFGCALNGDAIEAATSALLEEIVSFFPEGRRKILQKILQASRRYQEAIGKKLQAVMESGEIDRVIDSQLQKLNEKSMTVPESAE